MEMIRAFVAIELDDALKAALQRVQARFKRDARSQAGRWVSPDSIHLTLQFLGDVPTQRVDEIAQAIARGCAGVEPFSIHLAQPGFFPNARNLRVVWVGVEGDMSALLRLQGAVQSEIEGIGFTPEKRGFQPHLTLARVRDQAGSFEREGLAKLVSAVQVDSCASMQVHEVSLIRSELRPSGPEYTHLAALALTTA